MRKGFSITELIVVIVIIAIFAMVVVPSWVGFIRSMAFSKYSSYLELLARRAQILARQQNSVISVCVSNPSSIYVENLGYNLSASPCSGNVIGGDSIVVDPQYQSYIQIEGSGFSFDPRGYAETPGYICLQRTDTNQYYIICVNQFGGVTTSQGNGLCPTSC